MKKIFIAGILLGFSIQGAPALKKPFASTLPQGECRVRASRSAALDVYSERAATEHMDAWESDLLVMLVTDLQQRLIPVCFGEDRLATIALLAKRAYVTKLSSELGKRPDDQVKLLYQGLSVQKSDVPEIRAKLPKDVANPLDILRQIYATDVSELQGVLLIGPSALTAKLAALQKEICRGECPFWDPRYLLRVVVVTTKGLASYVPELGVLLLAEELLLKWGPLEKVVVLHELAHVAERTALLARGKDWRRDFARLSGWKKSKTGKWDVAFTISTTERKDVLTKASEGSSFSILPDGEVIATAGGKFDGFAMAKTLRAAREQNDPGEDLADHIALARLVPERFCLNGKPIAAAKFAWVRSQVLPDLEPLHCRAP